MKKRQQQWLVRNVCIVLSLPHCTLFAFPKGFIQRISESIEDMIESIQTSKWTFSSTEKELMFASGLQYVTFYMSILHILINIFTIQTYESHKQNGCSAHCGNGYFKKNPRNLRSVSLSPFSVSKCLIRGSGRHLIVSDCSSWWCKCTWG